MKPITIIGGGLAGLTLGIALRRKDVPVIIWEASDYPRHRVCGEFISGQGLQTFERLGLQSTLDSARAAFTVTFFSRHRKLFASDLPERATCISRFHLDTLLADRFRLDGGELRIHSRFKEAMTGEGIVQATGRRARAQTNGFHWYGLKAHATNVTLDADLEVHVHRDGYVGLCRLGGGRVNVCGLFRREPGDKALASLERLGGSNGKLGSRLQDALWDQESVCAVAGLPPYPEFSDGCCIGDASAMPAPLTGNGMSMAFESAELAVEPLVRFAQGGFGWDDAVSQIRAAARARFAARLRWSALLHRVLFSSNAVFLMPVLGTFSWRWLYRKTR